ncbi:MAG: glycogen-binding domain-containing protein [Spirochaetales bacterium]|nr:glycogen-binding domain-containing protein [Spirochaetales bacterium]
MTKRLLSTMVLMFSIAIYSYADVVVKNIDGTKVEIIFTHVDDSTNEVNVVGSFNNWTAPGTPMTKLENGSWEYRMEALIDDEILYKFYYNDSWISDPNAPATKDDGYAGLNGLIVVSDLLSQPAAPVSGSEVPVETVYKSKLNFGMYTILGSRSTFSTQGVVDKTDKGLEADTTGLYGKSYLKMGGTIVPDVNMWFEIKAFDAYQAFWEQDSRGIHTTEADAGLSNLLAGMLVNPVNYIGNGNPVLNSVKYGISSNYVNWETGYGYAKAQGRTSLLWETLEAKDANNGYMRFDLGSNLQKVGTANIEASIIPNMITGNYGLMGWVSANFNKAKVDFQYDMKSAASSDLSTIFDKLYHQDFIIGGTTTIGRVDVTAQSLINLYSEDDFDAQKHISGEAKVKWNNSSDSFGITGKYRLTGEDASLLFGNNDDALGSTGVQTIAFDIYGKPAALLKVGGYTELRLREESANDSADDIYLKPYADLDLSQISGINGWFNFYTKLNYIIEENYLYVASDSRFLLSEIGAKLNISNPLPSIANMDIVYGFNNNDEDKIFNTLISSFSFPNDLKAEIGFGLRTLRSGATQAETDTNNIFGFSVGGSWKVPVRKIKTPLLYGAFVYNMDPYDDGTNNLAFSDFVTTDGASKGDGDAQLRVMLKWDF